MRSNRTTGNFAVVAALALAGCATDGKAPEVRTVETRVLVPTPCIAAKDVPVRPAPLARPLPDDADALLSLALAQLKRWGIYGDKADAVIAPCVVP